MEHLKNMNRLNTKYKEWEGKMNYMANVLNSEPLNHLNREDKLKWLMKTYGDDVIRIAYTYLKQKQLAEDVAQEVFIKCYEKMDSFRNESSYKTWLIRITVNKCKDVLKSWTYKNLYFTDFFKQKHTYSSLENSFFGVEENLILSKQVIDLPVKLREDIILFYFFHSKVTAKFPRSSGRV
jgi:RNA polymerase sigma-70 factor (ECF subfamily)